MDLHRCIGAKRFPVIIALIVVLLIANVWESVMIELQYKMRMMGSLEKLMELLIFDRFKAAVIVLLSAVYTFGLCDDRNSSYDRLILFRCRPGEYLLSKLISNAIGVVSAVCISFVLFSIVLLPIMPLVGGDGMTQYFGYFACAMNFAYLDKEINATNIDGKSIQITDISLVYAVDELSSEGIQCSPYWRFGFQKRKNSESVWLYKDLNEYDTYSDTEDGKHQENGYFLINAVDGSIMY